MVLLVESLTPAFGLHFWEYVKAAGYAHRNKSTEEPQFYRFTDPSSSEYPFMIELFSTRIDAIHLPETAVLTPLPLADGISSLSAILMDEAYYGFLREGIVQKGGVTIPDAAHLIPFKAKAWLDLRKRKALGEHIDSKNIRKHRNDVFRLSVLLSPSAKLALPEKIYGTWPPSSWLWKRNRSTQKSLAWAIRQWKTLPKGSSLCIASRNKQAAAACLAEQSHLN